MRCIFSHSLCYHLAMAKPMDAVTYLGSTIRRIRERRRLSQLNIEERSRISRTYLSRLENGRFMPSLDQLARIAKAMKADVSEFFPDGRDGQLVKMAVGEVRFLKQIRQYAASVDRGDQGETLAVVKRMVTISCQRQPYPHPCLEQRRQRRLPISSSEPR